jgi:hypothetical protein
MPAKAARSWRSSIIIAGALLAGVALACPAIADDTVTTIPILAPPPSVWDRQMLSARPLLSQTRTDLANITTGILFGMGPGEVNAHMPVPTKGIDWANLPSASEFHDDVRYFWIRFQDARDLQEGATGCVGADSYIVFLFQPRGLFRISYRLLPDVACPKPSLAASEVFGRYVSLSTEIALSVHYRPGGLEIVDITDPTAGYLLTTRWQPPRAEE